MYPTAPLPMANGLFPQAPAQFQPGDWCSKVIQVIDYLHWGQVEKDSRQYF